MGTKPTNLRGDYWTLASKQVPWQIDIKERLIYVPEYELEAAKENLMVSHFTNSGFHIQSVIEGVRKDVFDPTIRLKQRPKTKSEFAEGDKFEVLSDGAHLCIHSREKERITLACLNRNKPNITTNIDQLRRVLNFNVWKRI